MSDETRTPAVYNIAAGIPFADTLASVILAETSGSPAELTRYKIMLPTRRGCRHMRDAFLRLTNGKPLLLPHLQTIGDIDEDELMLNMAGSESAEALLSIPPALDPIKRQIQMAKLISANKDFVHSPDHALKLAKALGQLLDQIYNENLDMEDLARIVPEDFADHWQITLEFLQIISLHWPKILEAEGVIDAADRRNRLINSLAQHWKDNPPQSPIIAAGSTGSMPATAKLLKTVANLPQGRLVLPGLDTGIDDESWGMLDDTHPQATLKNLLDYIGVERENIPDWDAQNQQTSPFIQARHILTREIMRPADSAYQWQNLESQSKTIQTALKNVTVYECGTQEEEAGIISVLMREILQDKNKTAALITPDRVLAKRVSAACKRWGINIDDSAGTPLTETPIGSFMALSVKLVQSSFSPISFLSFLRHPLVKMNIENVQRTSLINTLEIDILRGPAPQKGFEGLYKKIADKKEKAKKEQYGKGKDFDQSLNFIKTVEHFFTEFSAFGTGTHRFTKILAAHIELLEHMAHRDSKSGVDLLWSDDAGQSAAQLLSNLLEQHQMPDCSLHDYASILEHFMAGITVRSPYGVHPRLFIYGQLEARMIRADRVILASLNEGTWPPNQSVDPWMSRPMRGEFGLPSYERGVGLSAHDFALGMTSHDVFITRSKRVDGTPTIPARWLQRMDTVLQAANIEPKSIRNGVAGAYLQSIDHSEHSEFIARPAPCPPVEARPTALSVTAIEKWMRDPYSIYARYILRLRKLDLLEDKADAALRGEIIHTALEEFLTRHPKDLPTDALDILLSIGETLMQEKIQDKKLYGFWKPRFDNLAAWFIDHERTWRQNARNILTEKQGEITLGNGFVLRAKADRIDMHNDGSTAIIDYKTGSVPSNTEVLSGMSPQMPLEGLIVHEGGFSSYGCGHVQPQYLGFWKMTGAGEAGKEIEIKISDYDAFLVDTEKGITGLIDIFNTVETPYYSLPRPTKAPPEAWQDYAHLARVQEWVALDDAAEDAA